MLSNHLWCSDGSEKKEMDCYSGIEQICFHIGGSWLYVKEEREKPVETA